MPHAPTENQGNRIRLLRAFSPGRAVLGLLLIAGLIGFLVVHRYGESLDERSDAILGEESLKAFYSEPDYSFTGPAGPTGPAFFMFVQLSVRPWLALRPDWLAADARHFTYFLTYLLGVACLYLLARKFSTPSASLIAMLFFASQPLLVGHAFMNPKDTPFMSVFIISVYLGMRCTDLLGARVIADGPNATSTGPLQRLRADWRASSPRIRILTILSLAFGGILLVELLLLNRLILPASLQIIYEAYHASSIELVNRLFAERASNLAATPVTDYLWKFTRLYWLYRLPVALASIVPGTLLASRIFRSTIRPYVSSRLFRYLVFGAFALGFLVSIRVVGLFAGALVSAHWILRNRRDALRPLLAYWGLALSVSFITRPYFWDEPLQRILTSLSSVSTYRWSGRILFQGAMYSTADLPAAYSPLTFFAIQLTEPFVLLLAVGVLAAFWQMLQRKNLRTDWLVIWLWGATPIVAIHFLQIQRYDNFRHLLFALPAFFIVISSGLEYILERLRSPLARTALAAALLLPAVLAITQLHPYEYIYFNRWVGGTAGAAGRFEQDYWCTAMRESLAKLNERAESQARIEVIGPDPHAVAAFARDDLIVQGVSRDPSPARKPDYAIICIRGNAADRYYTQEPTVGTIERAGVVLSQIKRVR